MAKALNKSPEEKRRVVLSPSYRNRVRDVHHTYRSQPRQAPLRMTAQPPNL